MLYLKAHTLDNKKLTQMAYARKIHEYVAHKYFQLKFVAFDHK